MVEIDLHAGQVMVLETLWENDCQSQADIVRNLSVTPPTVYNLVVRLAKADFVEFRKSETDARIMKVCLLPRGIEIERSVKLQWEKLENQLLKNLTAAEKILFSMLLKKIQQTDADE